MKKKKSNKTNVIFATWNEAEKADGSRQRPYDLYTALRKSKEADEICLLPGIYRCGESLEIKEGGRKRSQKQKRIFCENDGHAVLDFGGSKNGIVLSGSNWILENLTVTHGYGFRILGSFNDLVNCSAIQNRETGIWIGYDSPLTDKKLWPRGNTVRNCLSCLNCDDTGQNADGFACKVAAGKGNRFIRCTAYMNADDGFDLFSKNRKTGAVLLAECESLLNGYLFDKNAKVKESMGNGCGFKLGGSGLCVRHKATDCRAGYNRGYGFTSNSNPYFHLKRCRSSSNGKKNFNYWFTGYPLLQGKRMTACGDIVLQNREELTAWIRENYLEGREYAQ